MRKIIDMRSFRKEKKTPRTLISAYVIKKNLKVFSITNLQLLLEKTCRKKHSIISLFYSFKKRSIFLPAIEHKFSITLNHTLNPPLNRCNSFFINTTLIIFFFRANPQKLHHYKKNNFQKVLHNFSIKASCV